MKSVSLFLLIWVSCLLSACGKFGPPIPPESLSPRPVAALGVSADAQGVKLTWNASPADQRGEELKTMDGYYVYRSVLDPLASPQARGQVSYELLGTIEDKHITELKRLREEALAAGKPTRRVKVDPTLESFEFVDKNVENGKLYMYKVVPFNQGGVEGQFNQFAKVLFKAENSEITFPKNFVEEIENVF